MEENKTSSLGKEVQSINISQDILQIMLLHAWESALLLTTLVIMAFYYINKT